MGKRNIARVFRILERERKLARGNKKWSRRGLYEGMGGQESTYNC
jgi:hypothetical protein